MKKITLSLALLAGSLVLTGCGSTGSSIASGIGQALINNAVNNGSNQTQKTVETGASVLENLLGSVLGSSSALTEKDLTGTWNYTGADCVFESENLLAKAGGAVAASKIESELNTQLAKVGIKQGTCSFTFNQDKTYSAKIGGRTIQGQYTLDTKNKTLTMTYLGGLAKMTPHIAKTNGKLSMMIESKKLLTLVKGISAVSNSSSLKAASSLLDNYDGMYVGMQLSK